MLTLFDLNAIAREITYKDGFGCKVKPVVRPGALEFEPDQVGLEIAHIVPDVRDRHTWITVQQRLVMGPLDAARVDERAFLMFIRQQVRELELHEIDEFLHYKGAFIVAPH